LKYTLLLIYIIIIHKCEVTELGAAAASILLQNLEPQGFFREAESKNEKDRDRQTETERKKEREIER
jgi:hypothetical protein